MGSKKKRMQSSHSQLLYLFHYLRIFRSVSFTNLKLTINIYNIYSKSKLLLPLRRTALTACCLQSKTDSLPSGRLNFLLFMNVYYSISIIL